MQEQEVEVSFCELCGTSVPAADLAAGAAVRHEGKTVGVCCLAALRAGGRAGGGAPKAGDGVGTGAGGGRGGDGGRLLTVAVVLLAALAGSVIFLDARMSRLEAAIRAAATDAGERQRSDSEVLMGVSLKVEDVATKADLAEARQQLAAIADELAAVRKDGDQRAALLAGEINAVRGEVRAASDRIVDYRPLFEDLRSRHQRTEAVIEGVRRELSAVPAAASAEQPPATSKPEPAAVDLPAELAKQVARLTAADPAVRFEAVDLLIESKEPKVLEHVLPLAKDPDGFVRRLTVEGLREFRRPEAVDVLIEALRDDDESVCDTAWRSLRELTGQKIPFDASASKDARGRAADKWLQWWEKARATFGS
ncbi:MAG TPA: hypothetical protein ENI87_07235 [bacterium]|nr:hypothetical protein [bacterium]